MAKRNETVLAFVTPIGADTRRLARTIRSFFKDAKYKALFYRLSDEIEEYLESRGGDRLDEMSKYCRYRALMDGGNQIRERFGHEAVAAMAVSRIFGNRKKRQKKKSKERSVHVVKPLPSTAHILMGIKHPAEVQLLREVYSSSLYVVGVYSSKSARTRQLQKAMTQAEAAKLIEIDEQEQAEYGQHFRDAFELSDVFVRVDDPGPDQNQLGRFSATAVW